MEDHIRNLKKRHKSISDTRHITHAMEMISISKLRKTELFLNSGEAYFKKISEIVSRISRSNISEDAPFFKSLNRESALFVFLASDKGYCGGFNHVISNFALKEIRKTGYREKWLFLVGRKGKEDFKKYTQEFKILGECLDIYRIATRLVFEKVVDSILDAVNSHRVGDVYLISYKFISRRKYEPIIQKILPISSSFSESSSDKDYFDYIFEPEPGLIFKEIVPQYLKSKVYMSFLEHRVCEHSARMLTMNNATKNCEDLISRLRTKMNKARQTHITNEIVDIISGAEAIL